MPEPLPDNALCAQGLTILEDHLGPVDTLRFLALVSREPCDYQQWREQHFAGMSLAEILTRVSHEPRTSSG